MLEYTRHTYAERIARTAAADRDHFGKQDVEIVQQIKIALEKKEAPANPAELWRKLEQQTREAGKPELVTTAATSLVGAVEAKRIRYDERYQERRLALSVAFGAF